ncbi:MAG: SH3 domain-containing protein [Geobacteraceae bacterium]|nr:SH3 domain-containing protein [Geobacteraceae bacterium]
MNKLYIAFCMVLLSGCIPPQQWSWKKPGGTVEEFNSVRYTCLQESQQQVSHSRNDAVSGVSSSHSITNENLFQACMNAKGWFYQRVVAENTPIKSKKAKQAPVASPDTKSDEEISEQSEGRQPATKSVADKPKGRIESQETAPASPLTLTVGSKANLRKSPSTKAVVVKTLREGEEVKVIKQKDNWFQVQLANGEVGWCHKSVLTESK